MLNRMMAINWISGFEAAFDAAIGLYGANGIYGFFGDRLILFFRILNSGPFYYDLYILKNKVMSTGSRP